jgi:hypothetical protein
MRFGLMRILTSNWIASVIVAIAAVSLLILYIMGKTKESLIGAAILGLALILIIRGSKKTFDDGPGPEDGR